MNQLSYNVSSEKFLKTGFKYEGSLEEIKETRFIRKYFKIKITFINQFYYAQIC